MVLVRGMTLFPYAAGALSSESEDVKWFAREELERINCFPDIRITMDYILQNMINKQNN